MQAQAFAHKYPDRPRAEWALKVQKYKAPGSSTTMTVPLSDMVRGTSAAAYMVVDSLGAHFKEIIPYRFFRRACMSSCIETVQWSTSLHSDGGIACFSMAFAAVCNCPGHRDAKQHNHMTLYCMCIYRS